jgi:hypothetical protein
LSSEKLVNFYQTTQRYNSKDSHLRTYRRENLKTYILYRRFIDLIAGIAKAIAQLAEEKETYQWSPEAGTAI